VTLDLNTSKVPTLGANSFNGTQTVSNGRIGIGTTTPDKALQIVSTPSLSASLHIGGAGDETKDLFAGMGPNIDVGGIGLNFGYSGYTFGRSSGFFNVRPDPSAVAPNPSLRFMTANQQRMIITNTGDVGIGTLTPESKVQADGGDVCELAAGVRRGHVRRSRRDVYGGFRLLPTSAGEV
jgi:hypothetical protein